MSKVVIAGSRTITDKDKIYDVLYGLSQDWWEKWPVGIGPFRPEFISGTAKGPDQIGEEFAEKEGWKVTRMEADWHKHGIKAEILRNIEMAKYGDILVAFWDGKSSGTRHMISQGLEFMNEVHVYRL